MDTGIRRGHKAMVKSAGMLMLILLLAGGVAAQEGTTCPAYVETALDAVSETCGAMGRNQVCYGNNAIDADFDAENVPVSFEMPGDRASIVGLEKLVTAPLTPDENIWGVAVMALQANLPDTTPGQNVTFILFGDAEVTSDETEGGDYAAPMQAFRLETRINGLNCEDVPESGLLVQAPEETTVNFLINGVEVKVGSSALLQIDTGDLTVDTIEGFVEVTASGVTEVAGEGVSVRVPRGQRPLRAAITRAARVARAPWRLLPRQVRALPPPPETSQTVNLNDCFYPNAARAASNPVSVRAGEPLALRFSVPHRSLELARVIQRRTQTRLRIDAEPTPVYTRVGPWHGQDGEYGENFGIELYWLIESPEEGEIRILLESESLTGRPIQTGVDGPDADNEPEIIPARRQLYCVLQANGS